VNWQWLFYASAQAHGAQNMTKCGKSVYISFQIMVSTHDIL